MESETQAVPHVWIGQSVQLQLKEVSKNRKIYEAVVCSLMDMGYEKAGRRKCKTKIKNLTAKYRKVKDSNRKSGNSLDSSFVYFVEMDAVCGIYKGCIGTTSSFARVNRIRIRSGLASNRI